jgi:hypothetical protein
MNIRVRRYRAVAAATAAVLCSVTAVVAAAAPAEAAAVKTVTVRMTDSSITFHGGGAMPMNGVTMLPAGRYHFHVVARDGGHSLQLARLQNGYTMDQLQQDIEPAFGGDVDAVQRVDNGVLFLGGARARPHKPGDMVARVRAGEVAALDVDGQALGLLQVTGSGGKASASHSGRYTAFSYGWDVSRHLPASGTVKLVNQADQPHFLVLQRVKDSTTNKQARKFVNSGAQGNPPWALKATADTGVLSPGKSQLISYDLPPGKYFIACFWPDYFTGAPHFLMGMWKLVTLS